MRPKRRLIIWIVCGLILIGSVVGLAFSFGDSEKKVDSTSKLRIDLYVRPEVFTAAYKAYGGSDSDLWVGKTIIKNVGDVPVRDFKISYEIPGYCEGTTSVQEYPLIVPGETVRDFCWPNFDAQKMAQITSKTNAELVMTYNYTGLDRPRQESEKFSFLGKGDWIWTSLRDEDILTFADENDNARFLAAMVTPRDPKVQKKAKRLAAGTFTGNDEGMMEALELVFNGIRDDRFSYVSTSGTYWSREGGQNVQYPRESLDTQVANCVDFSLLFSSLMEALGGKTYLALVTGHCMMALELPDSKRLIPLECTAVQYPECTLEMAIESATETFAEEQEKGTFMFIDVRDEWSKGMVPTW